MYSVHVDAATAGVGQYTAFILKAFNEEMSEDEQNVMEKGESRRDLEHASTEYYH